MSVLGTTVTTHDAQAGANHGRQAQAETQQATTSDSFYSVQGQRVRAGSGAFFQAIAQAYVTHARPRCLCAAGSDGLGPEMYLARLGDGVVVKRMPGTGSQHAPACASYEPPATLSGLGQVLGSAIVEDPATGETTLQLDFPLSKLAGRALVPTPGEPSPTVRAQGARLSLRGLLHYLWEQAALTRWHPGFAGKRSWAVVRKQLLAAAEGKSAGGQWLRQRLYVPEMFSLNQCEAIQARRTAFWSGAVSHGARQPLLLLIAEVKEIVPARYGFKAVIKHVPDLGFAVDARLMRRLGRRFETALGLWGATDQVHMVLIASFQITSAGLPSLVELSLMPTTPQWLPVEDGFELRLLEQLVAQGRAFRKCLRYDLPESGVVPTALLTDAGGDAVPLFIEGRGARGMDTGGNALEVVPTSEGLPWLWDVAAGDWPTLPGRSTF